MKDIKKYHDVLFDASITDKDKMSLTSMIALLTTSVVLSYIKQKSLYILLLP